MNSKQKQFYISLIKEKSKPLEVQPVGALPSDLDALRFSKSGITLQNIQTIIFDVYGTLFISASGDIGTALQNTQEDLEELTKNYTNNATVKVVKDYFHQAVLRYHERLYSETQFPEVRVEEIWEEFPGKLHRISGEEFALRYELAINPVYPMPGCLECLTTLAHAGKKIGIISNAQFYTSLLFPALLGKDIEELGFSSELLFFSYQYQRAKPAPELFIHCKEVLAKQGIEPEACLYIGNDMYNDVYGAKQIGFKTALFAGDARAFRLQKENSETSKILPDVVVCSLNEIPVLIGL
jgi:putative hydrolase of the HAD superfamily